eukprot:SAG31_NODE_3_length_45830_cov_42.279701_4_plen_436_part_00
MRPAAGHPAPVALLYVYLAAAVAGSASDGSVSFARDGGVGCQLPEFSGGMEPGNCSKFFQNGTSVYELPSGARCSPVCSPGTGLVVRGGLSPARFQQLQGRDIAEQGRYACEDGKLVSNFTEYFQCKFCYADKYQPSYKATPCIACGDHAGTKDPSGNDIYGSFTYQSCKCSPGYFNDVNHLNSKGSKGSMICMPCPPGTFKNDWGDGHKNYKHWPNGNVELVGNSCYNCSRGNYTADWSSTQCIRCPGDAPTVGAARSVADCFCPSGHYRRLNTTTTLLPRNTSASAAWNAGYSAEDLLSPSECHECPIGRYRNATNASGDTNACLQCPGGIRQSTLRAGSDSCVCASGFSPRQDQPWTRFRRSTQQDTVDADIGYIEDDGGPCVTCGYGYYKSVGNFKCTACPPSKTTVRALIRYQVAHAMLSVSPRLLLHAH